MDRGKVIKDLEECLSASCRGFRPRLSCPYNDEEWDIMRDALELLKEQDKIIQNILREKTNELNNKVTTLRIESQNQEMRRFLEQK